MIGDLHEYVFCSRNNMLLTAGASTTAGFEQPKTNRNTWHKWKLQWTITIAKFANAALQST